MLLLVLNVWPPNVRHLLIVKLWLSSRPRMVSVVVDDYIVWTGLPREVQDQPRSEQQIAPTALQRCQISLLILVAPALATYCKAKT